MSAESPEPFVIDNSGTDVKVLHCISAWCESAAALDIGTGHFEIGALLALEENWPKVPQIRLLIGDQVSLRTKREFDRALGRILAQLNESLEEEKRQNDFLDGVDRVVEALRSKQIQCRVYRKEKFHAKTYIARGPAGATHALVGSSNFTMPGLTVNVELNVQHEDKQAAMLAAWFERHWAEAEDVTPEILRTIERHVRLYSPFEVYAKSLREFYRDHDLSDTAWETGTAPGCSRMYKHLDKYQQDGYHNLLTIADEYNGAFLCDGVGLGKTFVGLMLIERLVIHEGKNVLLLLPKGAREAVWEPAIRQYLRHLNRGAFNNLEVLNHTDLLRENMTERIEGVRERAHAIVIDEAHHFRNPGPLGESPIDMDGLFGALRGGQIRGEGKVRPSRYRKLFDIAENKKLFLLTATPINNELADLRHMIELFSRRKEEYFRRRLGINSLRAHFIAMERELEALARERGEGDVDVETDLEQARQVLAHDPLSNALVVQRSRAYVKESQRLAGASLASFPEREQPKVADYSVKKTYGRLLSMVEQAFNKEKPLFSLAIYYPLAYYIGPDPNIDKFVENRQKQVVGLVRSQFLKRFESSVKAFERSCERLLVKLLTFVMKHVHTPAEKRRLEIWNMRNGELIGQVREHQLELFGEDEEPSEDLVSEEMLESATQLTREEYDVSKMIDESLDDLDTIAAFLTELQKFQTKHDDKLGKLKSMLSTDPVLKKHKVLIFTEFADTARYLLDQLNADHIDGVAEVDGDSKGRQHIIRRFAPYYNGSSSAGTPDEIRVLISTDVLSEGLNLQDATRVINYDLHWNPVRLMQRIGRVDRRLNPDIEARLVADHPEAVPLRGKIAYWNFLPPDELNELLRLYNRVAHKTLRISRTLGIETGKLLRPDDDYEVLREFNAVYEGRKTAAEKMHLEYEKLLKEFPELGAKLDGSPNRVFSGKAHPWPQARGVFFCFRVPGPPPSNRPPLFAASQAAGGNGWSEEQGQTRWYLYDLDSGEIAEEPTRMAELIRSTPDTPRRCVAPRRTLTEARANVEKHMKNTVLKSLQAPVGADPVLKAWMELSS